MTAQNSVSHQAELTLYRRLLLLSGLVYFAWWFAVEALLPGDFNPFLGRCFVVLACLGSLAFSYVNSWIRKNLRNLFLASLWLMTAHYFYLLHGNHGNSNWIIGCYITVIAINFGFVSSLSLFCYSTFVAAMAVVLVFLVPSLQHSIFLPGLLTIILQANVGMRSRFGLLRSVAQSTERFRLLLDSTFEGILVHENGIITDANKALQRMTGIPVSRLIGMNVLELIHPEERQLVGEKMKLMDVPAYETRGVRADGSFTSIEVRAKRLLEENQTSRLVTIQDITDRKKSEQDRIAAMTMAENVRLRDEFISIASHELKTPISALKLQTQITAREIRKKPEDFQSLNRVREVLDLFNQQIKHLVDLVDTMLDVSRISANRLTLNLEPQNLTELARKKIEVLNIPQVTFAAPDFVEVMVDPIRIGQVIGNLLTNTMKYGDGKPIEVRIEMGTGFAILKVIDQGIGIAPEFIDRIFERFERAVSPKNVSGLGLGLYITKQIVDAHNGQLSVESVLGQGSTFTVRLPLKSV